MADERFSATNRSPGSNLMWNYSYPFTAKEAAILASAWSAMVIVLHMGSAMTAVI